MVTKSSKTNVTFCYVLCLFCIGVLATSKQSIYRGSFADGKMSGRGRFRLSSADTIDASWADNKLQGHGKAAFANGMVYEGTFVDDRISGMGHATYQDGSKYEGEWKDGMRCGKGVLTLPDGCIYNGEWQDDKEHGFGTVMYPSGARFSGQWEHGRKVPTRPTTARLAPVAQVGNLSESLAHLNLESFQTFTEGGSLVGRTLNSAKSTFRTDMSNDVVPADFPSVTYASDIADSFVVPIAESPEPAADPQLLRTPTHQHAQVPDFNKFVPHLPLQQRPATGVSRPSSRMSGRERTQSLNSASAERILRSMNVRDLGLHPSSPPKTPLSTTTQSKFLTPLQPRLHTSHAFSRKDADKTPQPNRTSLLLTPQSPLPPVMSW
jgi:hypothetical protein